MPISDFFETVNSIAGAATVVTLIGAVFGVAQAVYARRVNRRAERFRQNMVAEMPDSLDTKMETLSELSDRSVRLTREIAVEVQARLELAIKAKEDADRSVEVANLSAAEKDAVAALVRDQISAELGVVDKVQRKTNFRMNLVFFALGVASSVVVTLFVQPIL
jgi:hypothetical protein